MQLLGVGPMLPCIQNVTCFGVSQCYVSNPLNARRIIDGAVRVEDSTVTVVSIIMDKDSYTSQATRVSGNSYLIFFTARVPGCQWHQLECPCHPKNNYK